MTNLDSRLKSRDLILPTMVHLIKAMVFPVAKNGCESWTIKKAECQRIDAFESWCWRTLLRIPWTARRSNQSIGISPEYSSEGLMLKLKLQYFGHLMRRVDSFIGKDPDAGKHWGQEKKGVTEDEMVGWYHWLNGHEFEQTPGDGEGQGSLMCCRPWGRKESDVTEWLNKDSGVACGILSCGMWDLVLWPWVELGPLALGKWNLSHWTTKEVPRI